MPADNWTPKRWTRRRAFMAGGTVATGLAAGTLGTALALAGTPAAKAPAASAASDASHAVISKSALTASSQSAGSDPDYYTYLSAAGGNEVVEVNVAAASITGTFSADSTEGVAAGANGSQIYIAETGQYSVLAVNPATKAQKAIEVGPYPQDVAVSPDGKVVYATVTGGDTGTSTLDAAITDIAFAPAP
jgi:DNA-binding beta-propeller fold protein YncE